ncbi:MAG: histidine phosphatase family protein [Bifidobacteriaceae bacterium]|jgi:broad specificity phosphatase PhoE|nr:histidine phosphatase family protein [Bifidobacteriaceae bacterium]
MAEPRTTIHLIRHGQVLNPDKRLYERLPGFGLTPTGHAMAERVAEHFKRRGGPIDALVASPLERAQQTAAPLARALGLAIRTDPRVIESQSQFAGQKINLPNLVKPSAIWRLRNPLRPSWGEPYAVIADRMHAVMADLRAEFAGGEVAVVSHQSPIWRARMRAEGRPIWPMPFGRACSLASVTSLVYEGDRLSAVRYCEPAADLLPPDLR